jgi:hypothetical protein
MIIIPEADHQHPRFERGMYVLFYKEAGETSKKEVSRKVGLSQAIYAYMRHKQYFFSFNRGVCDKKWIIR